MSKHHQHHQAQSQQKRDEHHQKEKKTELADIMGDDAETPTTVSTATTTTAPLQRPYVGQNVHFWRYNRPNAAIVREVFGDVVHLTVFTIEGNVDPKWTVDKKTPKLQDNVWDYIPNHNH